MGSLAPAAHAPPTGAKKVVKLVGPESSAPLLLYTASRTFTVCTMWLGPIARFTSEGAKPCAPMPSKSMPLVAETLGRTSFCTSGSGLAGLTTPREPSGIALGSGASTSPRPSTSMGSSLRGRETAWPVGYLTIVLVLASWANARAVVSARQHITTAPLQGRNFLQWLTDFLLEENWNRLFPGTAGNRGDKKGKTLAEHFVRICPACQGIRRKLFS